MRVAVRLLILLSLCALQEVVPSTASAAVHPCSTEGRVYDGITTQPSSAIFGARAEFEFGDNALCGSSAAFADLWVMLSATTDDGGLGWAQIGYGNFQDNTYPEHHGEWVWSQWSHDCTEKSCPFKQKFVTRPTGTSNLYSVKFNQDDYTIHMNVDGVTVAKTKWDPLPVWSPDWTGTASAESLYLESDAPGTKTDPVDVTQPAVEDGTGFWGHNTKSYWSELVHPSRYSMTWTDPQHTARFRIYTDPLDGL